ncbi:MAG: hypothetical protein RLN88_05950 [Ekhidna sp.]|uniref:hypothetical protein n=1 Tax=Ekhidna sp. TaxID=2608089 RepID=UPI0032EB64FE
MKQLTLLFIPLLFVGCQKLKPESVSIPEYPDFAELMKDQVELLGEGKIEKQVMLGDEQETQFIMMDSTRWVEELSFLKEINPNQPEYVGTFEKSEEGNTQTLSLGANESGALKKVIYAKDEDGYTSIEATFHEDKDVYIHHREIKLNFEKGILSSYQINGYQKMMMKDTVRFGVELKVD